MQLPILMAKHRAFQQQQQQTTPSTPTTPVPSTSGDQPEIKTEVKTEEGTSNPTAMAVAAAAVAAAANASGIGGNGSPEKKAKFGFPASQAQNYTVADCRALVKTLVCGVKTITWGLTSTKVEPNPALGGAAAVLSNNQFQPKETLVYIR